jgi:hypothetical protein
MMQDTHAALRAQYEAEAKVNPAAWKNWQLSLRKNWQWWDCNCIPSFEAMHEYRRNPDAPPFVPPVDGRAAMQAEALAEMGTDYTLDDGIPPPKRHKHADIIIAAANGEQMQCEVLVEKGKPERMWQDCSAEKALSLLMSDDEWYAVRIKQKTRTVQCRLWRRIGEEGLQVSISSDLVTIAYGKEWIGEVFSVEVPV